MKRIVLVCAVSLFYIPVFGQNLASNQVWVNDRIFTIGTNAYTAEWNNIRTLLPQSKGEKNGK